MWVFNQLRGSITNPDGQVIINSAYSGNGEGLNNPYMETVKDVGPIPCGFYIIGNNFDSERMGPFVLPLTPDPENEMYNRDGFYIHGDRKDAAVNPHKASDGCIISPLAIRQLIRNHPDKLLQVVSGLS